MAETPWPLVAALSSTYQDDEGTEAESEDDLGSLRSSDNGSSKSVDDRTVDKDHDNQEEPLQEQAVEGALQKNDVVIEILDSDDDSRCEVTRIAQPTAAREVTDSDCSNLSPQNVKVEEPSDPSDHFATNNGMKSPEESEPSKKQEEEERALHNLRAPCNGGVIEILESDNEGDAEAPNAQLKAPSRVTDSDSSSPPPPSLEAKDQNLSDHRFLAHRKRSPEESKVAAKNDDHYTAENMKQTPPDLSCPTHEEQERDREPEHATRKDYSPKKAPAPEKTNLTMTERKAGEQGRTDDCSIPPRLSLTAKGAEANSISRSSTHDSVVGGFYDDDSSTGENMNHTPEISRPPHDEQESDWEPESATGEGYSPKKASAPAEKANLTRTERKAGEQGKTDDCSNRPRLNLKRKGAEADSISRSSTYDSDVVGRDTKRAKRKSEPPVSRAASAGEPQAPTVPSKPTIAELESSEAKKKRKQNTNIGSRVYAKWNSEEWFWAVVTAIKRKERSHVDQYSLLFDDGDELEFVSLNDIISEEEYRVCYPKKPPPLPRRRAKEIRKRLKKLPSTHPSDQLPMTLNELLVYRCGKCVNCEKDDCGRCVSCTSNCSSDQECVQKMCCDIPIDLKAQPMPPSARFPDGWRFFIDPTVECLPNCKAPPVQGLQILPRNGKRAYHTVEAARGQFSKVLAECLPENFYAHIGAMSRLSKAAPQLESTARDSTTCGVCENCTKDACGRCARCRSGSHGGNRLCFHKMCFETPVEEKAEPAIGFPEGWRFYFDKEKFIHRAKYNSVRTLWIIPPKGGGYRSAQSAVDGKKLRDGKRIVSEFYNHVGLTKDGTSYDSDEVSCESRKDSSDRETRETDKFLVGRKFSFAWTNIHGRRKLVYGDVVGYVHNEEGDITGCQVVYTKESRELMNRIDNGCGSVVPESQMLCPKLVIGACMLYEAQNPPEKPLSDLVDLPFYWKWISPEFRSEELGNYEGGKRFPRLTLVLRGFRLELNVKPSTIRGAGNGVFLSCTRLDGATGGDFELDAGELVDLGIYGPYRMQDKKSEAAFDVKNFIHSSECEVFAFDPKVSKCLLDITDDITGDLHAIAKSHIYAYVNESDDDRRINIRAEHDAENSVHYLLGHGDESQGKFSLPSDGSEVEVFINYGPGYEKIRVRKGYGFVSEQERNDILEELEDEDIKDLKNMDSFSEDEVETSVNFLFGLFSKEDDTKFKRSVVERALISAAVLHRRAQRLFLKDSDGVASTEANTKVNLKSVLAKLGCLVGLLLRMTRDERDGLKQLYALNDVDGFLRKILERTYSNEQQEELGTMMD